MSHRIQNESLLPSADLFATNIRTKYLTLAPTHALQSAPLSDHSLECWRFSAQVFYTVAQTLATQHEKHRCEPVGHT